MITLPLPNVQPTLDANAQQAAEQTSFWRFLFHGQSGPLITVSVPFRADDDDIDVLASRVVEQEMLDMLDEPTSR